MRLLPLMLALTVTAAGTAAAVTLRPAGVYALPGADVEAAWALSGGRWAVSADNAVMILGADLRVVRAWHTLRGTVRALAVSPQGTRVAAMTRDTWAVWDVQGGALLGTGRVYGDAVGFDADGNVLVMYRGALLRNTLEGGPERFTALDVGTSWSTFAASPDGTRAVVMDDTRVRLLDLAGGEVLASAEWADVPDGFAATFSPDGETVVVRTGTEALVLRPGADALEVEDGGDVQLDATAVYFSAPGTFVSVIGRRAQAYDATTGRAVGERFGVPGGVVGGPDGRFLAVGRGVATFDAAAGRAGPWTPLVSSNAWLGAFLPDGKFYAGVDDLRALRDGTPLNVGPLDDVYSVDALGGRVWTLNGSTLRVTQAGRVRTVADLDEDAEYDTVSLSPDGTLAAVSGYDVVTLVDGAGRTRATVTAETLDTEDIHAAVPTPDGRGVLVVTHEGTVRRYDVATRRVTPVLTLPGGEEVEAVQVTPGGTVATLSTDDEDRARVSLVRPGSARPYVSVTLDAAVRALRFTPDGKRLAVLTSGADAPLRVYDTATGALLASAGPFNNTTTLLTWSASGRQLMVGSGLLGRAGSVTVFDVVP